MWCFSSTDVSEVCRISAVSTQICVGLLQDGEGFLGCCLQQVVSAATSGLTVVTYAPVSIVMRNGSSPIRLWVSRFLLELSAVVLKVGWGAEVEAQALPLFCRLPLVF
jgi:hypothetical protein